MSGLWLLAAATAAIALAVACGGSASHSDSHSVAQGAGASQGGAGLAGGGVGQATAGSGGQSAGESPGGGAAGSVAMGGSGSTMGGSGNVAGLSGSAGAQTDGGTGWIVPAAPGAGWTGPQDPACPVSAVSTGAACTGPAGTRCQYPQPDSVYTLRCQCYVSSTGDERWWCEQHASFGWDSCPVAYTGDGSCPNIGDVTCYYVDDQDKLKACNCLGGTSHCFPWGS